MEIKCFSAVIFSSLMMTKAKMDPCQKGRYHSIMWLRCQKDIDNDYGQFLLLLFYMMNKTVNGLGLERH